MVAKVLRRFAKTSRDHDLTWRWLHNLAPTVAWRLSRRPMVGEGARVLEALRRDGVAVTSVGRLLGSSDLLDELRERVLALEGERSAEIEAARAEAADESAIGRKTFLHKLLGEKPDFDPQDVFSRFALQLTLLDVANAYFGMFTQLRYYNVWRTFATRSGFRESQLWHRDREDRYILKLFLNLSDVDEGAGPFTYAPGTHMRGPVRDDPEFHLEGDVRRSDDAQMARLVPESRWIRGSGPVGTLVLADTRGYHRGGRSRERDRLLFTCLYTSQASDVQELFGSRIAVAPPRDPAAAFALRRGRNG
jgi:hypothetical protein